MEVENDTSTTSFGLPNLTDADLAELDLSPLMDDDVFESLEEDLTQSSVDEVPSNGYVDGILTNLNNDGRSSEASSYPSEMMDTDENNQQTSSVLKDVSSVGAGESHEKRLPAIPGKTLDEFNLSHVEALKLVPKAQLVSMHVPPGSKFTHTVAIPSSDYRIIQLDPIVPRDSAKKYKYKLDHFQTRAINCVDKRQSVLVSAPAGSGKTSIAEYAVAKGLRAKQRVIYTTPIESLGNKKYQEFKEIFGNVGRITGTMTLNQHADCLITSIQTVRNWLFEGSKILKEVGWIVFDDLHHCYMADKEQCVLLEEVLILLPPNICLVFLSITIPNYLEFALWISHNKAQSCHVIYTDYRPVAINHYLYPVGSEEIQLVVDGFDKFHEDGFEEALKYLQKHNSMSLESAMKQKFKDVTESPFHTIIDFIMNSNRNMGPVIVFCYTKKDCQVYAAQISDLDFNTAEDKNVVEQILRSVAQELNGDEQQLLQLHNLVPLLRRGIGIHHEGMLPLVLEMIEMLFAENFIKVLFATDVFSTGLNLSAQTVLFTNVRIFDGLSLRWMTSGEYNRLSGRAGRRGLDASGVSIIMTDEKILSNVSRGLLKCQPDPINSKFHLNYNMILHLMRVDDINSAFMIEKSFYQFQNHSKIPGVLAKLQKLEADHEKLDVPMDEEVSTLCDILIKLGILDQQRRELVTKPKYIKPFLQPGRLINLKDENSEFGWGAVVKIRSDDDTFHHSWISASDNIMIDALIRVASSTSALATGPVPPPPGEQGELIVFPVLLSSIYQISSIRVFPPVGVDLVSDDGRKSILKSIEESERKYYPDDLPPLNPIDDMGIQDKSLDDILNQMEQLEKSLEEHPQVQKFNENNELFNVCKSYEDKVELAKMMETTKEELKGCTTFLQMCELKCRQKVLRHLGYITENNKVDLKGLVACHFTVGDGLLLTEMLFSDFFTNLDVSKSVALLSCLVCEDRSNDIPRISKELSGHWGMLQDLAQKIARVSTECQLEMDEAAYVSSLKPYLMDIVYQWCNNAPFFKICDMTNIYEGGIIQCLRRLEQLLRQLIQAASMIRDKKLVDTFNEGVKLIHRGVVSLHR